jgi:hypothetical protein
MIIYGMVKFTPGADALSRIDQAVAAFRQLSPMGVLCGPPWAQPRPYEIFAGFAEVAGGLLLIVSRTATLGALISCARMIQVLC